MDLYIYKSFTDVLPYNFKLLYKSSHTDRVSDSGHHLK